MPANNADDAKRLEIRKYPNRRYYDTTQSRHLTLEEIRSLVQQGHDLRVVDARTSADITAQVLTQIILELDTPKLDSLPVPLLLRIIRMNDQLVKDFIEKYFNQALKSFLDYQHQLEEQIRRAHGLPSLLPSVSAWAKAMFEPITSAFSPPAAAPAPASASAQEPADTEETIGELQARIARLKKTRARRPTSRRPRRGPKK